MYFKSRTDVDNIDANSPMPAMGPAGTIVVDPETGNEIVRATDDKTMIVDNKPISNMAAGIGGSADVNQWNSDSTLLAVSDGGGGGAILSFDPKTMAVRRVFPKWRVCPLVFSRLDPNVAFHFNMTRYDRYDLSDLTLDKPPAPETVCDFAGLLGTRSAKWKTIGGVEGSDTVFSAAYSLLGAQGTGVHACVYVSGKGYRLFNTRTGEVTGDFGPTGTIEAADRFTIHNLKGAKGGKTVTIGVTTQMAGTGLGPFFWDHESLNVYPMSKFARGGHWTTADGEFLNNSAIHNATLDIDNWTHCRRPLTNMDAPTQIAKIYPDPDTMWGVDDHLSFNGQPNSMFVVTSTSAPSPGKTKPFPAWWDEVLGFDLSGNGKVYRFCRHFSNTQSGNFAGDNAIAVVDQLNRFVSFTSNWNSSLLNGRTDAFIVRLR